MNFLIVDSILNTLTPICICVVLPIAIVWLIMRTAQFRESKRTEVILKAIETNNIIDADKLAQAMMKPQKPPKTPQQQLNTRLTIGCIFTFIGISLPALVLYIFGNDEKALFIFGSIGIICLGIGIGFLISYFTMRKYVK